METYELGLKLIGKARIWYSNGGFLTLDDTGRPRFTYSYQLKEDSDSITRTWVFVGDRWIPED